MCFIHIITVLYHSELTEIEKNVLNQFYILEMICSKVKGTLFKYMVYVLNCVKKMKATQIYYPNI